MYTIRKKSILVILILLFTGVTNIKSQTWQWAFDMGGLNNDAGRVMCTDAQGNVIVAGGYFASAMNIGTVSINNAGGGDIFLAKFDPQGNLMWVQTIGGPGLDIIGGVCTGTNGNVYVSGAFSGSVITVSGNNLTNASTSGTQDVFVACYSSLGSALWSFRYGSTGAESAGGITYSSLLNNIFITGNFSSPSFAIGATTLNNSSGSTTNDLFFARFNTSGTPVSAFSTGGSASNDYGTDIDVDASGNLYITGAFQPVTGSTSFIGASVTTNGSQDMYLVKYSSAGAFQWVRSFGSNSGSDAMTGVEVDGANNILVSGHYFGTSLMISTSTIPNSGAFDGMVAKYNSAGTFQWVNTVNGTGSENANGLTVDGNNDVYITGSFSGTTAISNSATLTNSFPGQSEVYVVKYTSVGTQVWTNTAQGNSGEVGYAVTADALGNLYVTGAINNGAPAYFGTYTLTSSGSNDAFLAKIGCASAFISGTSTVCIGTSATLTASGATSYSWSTGAITPTIVITPTASTVYSVSGTAASGSCIATGNDFSVTLLQASVNPGANLNLFCKQKQVVNASTSPVSATSVVWTPTINLSSGTVLTPTATGANGSINYTVTALLSNGCYASNTLVINTTAQTPNICMVTVDSLGTNNEIYWEKTSYPQADSFIVYRETSTSIYKRIGAISRTAFSMYTDTNRTIGPANGDPNLTYYRYKLQTRDSCGNYSPLSLYHETLFVQDQQNGNFNWNSYSVESSPTPVSNYNLKRRDLVAGTETLVVNTVGNLATDPNYNTLWNSQTKWFVDAVGFICNPTQKLISGTQQTFVQKIKTKSNQANDKKFPPVGIKKETYVINTLNVFPNPAKDLLNIKLDVLSEGLTLELKNVLGQKIYSEQVSQLNSLISIASFPAGIYFMNIIQDGKIIAAEKVVINK